MGAGIERSGGDLKRLVGDRDRDALDQDRDQRHAPCALRHRDLGRRLAEEDPQRPPPVGEDERARLERGALAPRRLSLERGPGHQTSLDAVSIEGLQSDAGLHGRDRDGVIGEPARPEAAVFESFDRELLDRSPRTVRVEPDVPEEDAIGPRHRLLAKVDRVGTEEAV